MKKHYYVGIIANDIDDNELKFVYNIDTEKNVAEWETYKKIREQGKAPKEFSKVTAEEITKGLNQHLFLAVVIESFIELK